MSTEIISCDRFIFDLLRRHSRNEIDGKHTRVIKSLTHWSCSLVTGIHTGLYRTAEEYTVTI